MPQESVVVEKRRRVMIALCAAVRWKSSYTDDHTGDQENLEVISELIADYLIETTPSSMAETPRFADMFPVNTRKKVR